MKSPGRHAARSAHDRVPLPLNRQSISGAQGPPTRRSAGRAQRKVAERTAGLSMLTDRLMTVLTGGGWNREAPTIAS